MTAPVVHGVPGPLRSLRAEAPGTEAGTGPATAPPGPRLAAAIRARSWARGLMQLSRPGQWLKNLLVLAAPAAAGVLDRTPVMGRTLVLLIAFTAASVAVYALNDVQDAALDRQHPRKRRRPVAAGTVSAPAALVFAVLAACIALALGTLLGPGTMVCVAGYLAVSGLYCVRLKHVAVLDVVAVASGFVLRAMSGAAANHLPVSNWFLLVSLFGALYLVSGKRRAEQVNSTSPAIGTTPADPGVASATASDPDDLAQPAPGALAARPVLAAYPADWLQQLVTLSLAGTLLSYAMWAFQYLGTDVFHPVLAASFVPFLIALLRYGLLLAQGDGERPEHLLVHDRMLVAAGLSWVLMTAASLYLA